jgi:arginyl-tRNA synthetase
MYNSYITETLQKAIKKAIVVKDLPECEIPPVEVKVPGKKEYGDYFSTVAMILASQLSMDPYQVARKIVSYADFSPSFTSTVSCAPRGFINITLSRDALCKGLLSIVQERESFWKVELGRGAKVFIEPINGLYNGLFNVDEGRKLLVGDFLKNLMEFTGYHVTMEPLMRDCGESNRILGLSVEARYREQLGDDSPFPVQGYKNKFIVELAKVILHDDGAAYMPVSKGERISILRERAAQKIAEQVKKVMKNCGVEMGHWVSARQLMEKSFSELKENLLSRSLLYEKDEKFWFMSSEGGDQKDRVLSGDNKETTDFAIELCFLLHTLKKGYDKVFYLKSHDEALEFYLMMSCALKLMGYSPDRIEVLPLEKVKILEKSDKELTEAQKGDHMSFEELYGAAGRDAIRFFYFLKNIDTPLEFDLSLVHKESNLNPLYYIQYACCRLKSIMKMAESQSVTPLKYEQVNLRILEEKNDIELLRKVVQFPTMMVSTVKGRDPYILVFYAAELVNEFQNYYQSVKIFSNDAYLTKARVMMMEGLKIVLFKIMELLKIKVPEKM